MLRLCRDAGSHVTIQGGRTSLVAGTVPSTTTCCCPPKGFARISEVDSVERRIEAGAGATLAAVQHAATASGLVFGVDLAARDTATVGGMASTNAGGLRTVRYGNMGSQVIGMDVALPDGSVVRRHSQVRADNTGYDLPSLFVGAEGTLGVITALDLRLHLDPAHRVTAVCGFEDLDALVDAGRLFRDLDGIAALELIDGRAGALADEHLGVAAPVDGAMAAAGGAGIRPRPDRATRRRAGGVRTCGEPAVGVDLLHNNGFGGYENRWPRCSASSGRR